MSDKSASGQHLVVDCMFCVKTGIRSDHYPEHMRTHLKKSDALDVQSFAEKYEGLITVGNVIVKPTLHKGTTHYLDGTCWDCKKYIINDDTRTTDIFELHTCKIKGKAKKSATDTEKLKKAKEPVVEDTRTLYERYKPHFLFHASKEGLLQAPSTGSDLLAKIKSDKELAYLFDGDENDDEMTDSILSALKTIKDADAKWRKKMEQTETKYEAEIQKMTMDMGQLNSKFLIVQENYLSADKDVSLLHDRIRQQDETIRTHLNSVPTLVVSETNTVELDALRKQLADAAAEIATLTQKLAEAPTAAPVSDVPYSAGSTYNAQDDLVICRMALSDARRDRDGAIKELEEVMEEFAAYKEKSKAKKPAAVVNKAPAQSSGYGLLDQTY